MSEMLDRQEVLERLCKLSEEIHRAKDPISHHPSDCFCGKGGFWGSGDYGGTYKKGYRNDGYILRFIERTIRKTLRESK